MSEVLFFFYSIDIVMEDDCYGGIVEMLMKWFIIVYESILKISYLVV